MRNITEASGLVASRSQKDLLWTHNDSGDELRIFGIYTDGTGTGKNRLST